MTKYEAKDWLVDFSSLEVPQGVEVVVFPPFTLLDVMNGYVRVNSLPFKIGAQDLSPFDKGAFTGEVSASQIKEFADYVLIGHSERRKNFSESMEMVKNKIEKALSSKLKPIVCISNIEELEGLEGDLVIAYEPLESVGTGNPADPNLVEVMAKKIKEKLNKDVIYGGSVNAENVRSFIDLPSINGVLVGGVSLDPKSFINLIKNAI